MSTDDESTALRERYNKALASHAADAHGMQTGVAHLLAKEEGIDSTKQPGNNLKHLRVGVNVVLVDHASLVQLLINKGVITDLEYAEAIAKGMRAERERYEELVSKAYGNPSVKITLG